MHQKKIELLNFIAKLDPEDKRVDMEFEVHHDLKHSPTHFVSVDLVLSAEQFDNLLKSGLIRETCKDDRATRYEVVED